MSIAIHPRRGFTLIELLISIGLGLVIVYTCMAGFRVASQSVTVANRLSLENSLMRAGFLAALDEADFWWQCDDPQDTTRQRLRAYDSGIGRGLPFTPLAAFAFSPVPAATILPLDDPARELERGFDPEAYKANDPRGWFRGNMAENAYGGVDADGKPLGTTRIFGHYELFTHVKSTANLTLGDFSGIPFGTVQPRHTWYMNQLNSLKKLGYSGMLDYMPANCVFATYGTASRDQCMDGEWTAGWSNGTFSNGDGGTKMALGRYRLTKDTSYLVVPAWTATGTDGTMGLSRTDLIRRHHTNYATGAWTNDTNIENIYKLAFAHRPVLDQKPLNWPELDVGVMRYTSHTRATTLCKVRWTSPLTGELAEVSFTTQGTTMRGARRQRNLDQ